MLGNETGTAEVAEEPGATHIPQVRRNKWDTPLMDDIFRQAHQHATGQVLAYLNADIILLDDFAAQAETGFLRSQGILT